ncbi:MAG: aldehyde dehydrogenase family protein, partial [Kiritimatiellae bacterium]|nr:aldehyde dehydrogenase family protein [Kiritimatiellia bacterium]
MFTATNPTTGEEIKSYPPHDPSRVSEALQAARDTWKKWKTSSFSERADLLNRVAQVMEDDIDSLAEMMTLEMGKPVGEAIGEVKKSIWCARHYAEKAEEYLAPISIESDASHSYVQHLPLGTILGILPWNAPFWLAFRFCAPALMAGNTCLMKHDPHVPGCAEAIAACFSKAGAPKGLMQNLRISNSQIADLLRDDTVRGVSLTGSSGAGSQVAAVAGQEIKPVVLELGGSDPSLICADADLDRAAE